MKTHHLADYLSNYINEELERGNTIDTFTLRNAIEAFENGAGVKNSIFIEWCIDDVKDVREDLDDEQAMEVLEFVKDKHDANLGVTWETLQYAADHLFPEEVLP
jgi:hypothetical protein